MAHTPIHDHAIVIGGSMAGLLAARTLADHFAKVTIVERDQLQNDASLRPGVPQARHVHILLARGQQILESLFPNFLAKLEASGVKPLDFTNDFAIALGKEWEQRFPSSLTTYPCNRMTIEWLVRHELSAFPQIHWQTQQEVIGLERRNGIYFKRWQRTSNVYHKRNTE